MRILATLGLLLFSGCVSVEQIVLPEKFPCNSEPEKPIQQEDRQKQRIAVVDFVERGELGAKDAGAVVAELVLSKLSNKYDIIERIQFARIIQEQQLSLTDIVQDNDIATKVGRVAKVHFLLVGTVAKLGNNIVIAARLVNCTTGSVAERGSITVSSIDAVPSEINRLLFCLSSEPNIRFNSQSGTFRLADDIGVEMIWLDVPESALSKADEFSTEGFFVGSQRITNGQYQKFLQETGYKGRKDADRNYLRHWKNRDERNLAGYDQPVVYVSWKNATRFCDWLSKKTGQQCRLLLEKEWNYICSDNVKLEVQRDLFQNCRISGDFWEFCLDDYVQNDDYKVIRQSFWKSPGVSKERTYYKPFRTWNNIGFRIVVK